jgi:hypothetical protein
MSTIQDLRKYMDRENITGEMFARICNLNVKTIYTCLNGGKIRADTARKIHVGTRGEIDLGIEYKSNKWYTPKVRPFTKRKICAKKTKQTCETI